jgi:2-polyprenyl-6-methoxyphenol hydroxylase-like FAD-dependent oxidoreductase
VEPAGVIIGGGIAGLTAAIAMQQLGIPVRVYESAPAIRPLGAGIWMAPNAMQVFHRLGIADKINQSGVQLQKIQVVDKSYRPIMHTNQDRIRSRFGYTTTAIKRSLLQNILLTQVGAENVYLSKTCVSIEDEKEGVRVSFADGTNVNAPFVIAADGIHSVARGKICSAVRFSQTGYIVLRGISHVQLKPKFKKAIIEAWHGGLRFGFSEVADGVVDWFAVEKADTSRKHSEGLKTGLLHTFKEFSYPVPAILENADEQKIIQTVLTDFDPIPTWHSGKVCLIGDAAHASTPYMGQGGCQAVEDGYVVAQCLHAEPTPEKAFEKLEAIRKGKAIQIVRTSRMMGRVGYLHDAAGSLRNFIIRSTPGFIIEQQFIQVYSLKY